MIKWSILYSNFDTFSSDDNKWEDLPFEGIISIIIEIDKNKMIFSGWDVYWLMNVKNGIRVGVWKDDDPNDPYYHMGQERVFLKRNDKDIYISKLKYKNFLYWKKIPRKYRKRGRMVSEETAKMLGIL